MPVTRIPGAALAAALLAAFAFAAPAAAAPGAGKLINNPAEKYLIAPGGVDMRTGRYVYSETDLTGGGEQGALALTRILPEAVGNHANPFGNFSHNWDIFLIETMSLAPGDDTVRANVHYGGRSLTFETRGSLEAGAYSFRSDGPYASLTYTGLRSDGSAVHTMRGPDGTELVFRPLGSSDCADQAWGSGRRRCAFVSEMIEPDGTRYRFDYVATGGATGNLARLARVTSSRGYALLLQGSGSLVAKACLFNLALGPAPAPGADCPPGALATAAYGYSGNRLATAASPGGGVSSFTYAPGRMGFVKPGQPEPWLTNMLAQIMDEEGALQEIVTGQAFAGGQTYAYAYGTAPITSDALAAPFPSASTTPNIAGGSYKDSEGRETLVRFDFPVLAGSVWSNHCVQPPCEVDPPWDGFMNWVYQQTPGPVEITDPLGRTTRIDYCDPGATGGCSVTRMQSSIDPDGIRTTYEYDGRGNIGRAVRYPRTGAADPGGIAPAPIVVEATYDVFNPKAQTKPLRTKDGRGNVTTYRYAPEHGGLLIETAPAVKGISPQKRYSYAQRQARMADGAPAGPPVWLLERMSFCRAGKPAEDGKGCALGPADEVVTSYDYGPAGGPGNLLLRGQAVTADGATLRTCFAYDAQGRKISETSPNGTAGVASCPAAPPVTALPYTSSLRYDPDGRVTGTIAPDPDGAGPLPAPAVRNSYDPAGRLTRVEQGSLAAWQSEAVAPAAWTGFAAHRIVDSQYDPLDRKLKEAVSGAPAAGGAPAVRTVTEYSYDLAGRLRCTAVRMNPAEFALPPRDACRQGTAHPVHGADRITRNVYDDAGQPIELWDGAGTELERREAAWTYDEAGRKTSLTDARGYRAEMKYDGHGHQSLWIFPSKTSPGTADAGDYELYSYDPNGNRISLRKRDGSVLAFDYDALNRMAVKRVPERPDLDAAQTRDVHYDYDNRGLQTKARFDSLAGPGITNSYDGFGRLVWTSTSMDGTDRRLSSEYDSDGRRTILWDQGVSYSGRYFYDGLGRMTAYLEGLVSPAFQIAYDPAGRRSGVALGVGGASSSIFYLYDEIGRLKLLSRELDGALRDQSLGFDYNAASQIIARTGSNDAYAWTGALAAERPYAVNGLNQYISAGPATFDYDSNGNLRSVAHADHSVSYRYDVENRLVAATGAQNATLAYDPLGRLWQISGPAGTTRFLYDGDDLIQEYDGSGALLRDYDHAFGADEPLIWHEYAGGFSRRFLHADHQGSIVAVTDTNGAAIAINSYDEYGVPGLGNQGRFQYTGQTWLPELRLYYYKARLYSPTLGRFLQVDPIGYDDQVNLYAYVGNDPINRSDPSGTQILRANPFDSDVVRDKKQEIREAMARGLWEAEKKGYWLLATLTSFAFGPEGQIGKWVAVNESMSPAALAFQVSQGGRAGQAFVVNGVRFDGVAGKTLIEAKSRHDKFIRDGAFFSWFQGRESILTQAENQVRAVAGRARIEWRVQGRKAADAVRNLFNKNGITGINVRTVEETCTGTRLCRR